MFNWNLYLLTFDLFVHECRLPKSWPCPFNYLSLFKKKKQLQWCHPLWLVNVYFNYSIRSCWIYRYPTVLHWDIQIFNCLSVGYSNIQQCIKQLKKSKGWNVYFQQTKHHKSKLCHKIFLFIHISDKTGII